jgi:hypothetical protein
LAECALDCLVYHLHSPSETIFTRKRCVATRQARVPRHKLLFSC